MKNKKKAMTKLFYTFLTENGILFQFLNLLIGCKYKTLEEHCKHVKVSNYIKQGYNHSSTWYEWDRNWKIQHIAWCDYVNRYFNQQKKKK